MNEIFWLYKEGFKRLGIEPPYEPTVRNDGDYTEYDFGYAMIAVHRSKDNPRVPPIVVEHYDISKGDLTSRLKARDNDYYSDIHRAIGAVIGHTVSRVLPNFLRSLVADEAKESVI